MIEGSGLFMTQIFLLVLMAVGVMAAKTGIVREEARSSISDLVLNVFLPCNIVSSFFGADRARLPSLGIILAVSFGIIAVCLLLGQFILYRKVSPAQKRVLLYATIISNAAFLGNPVVESVYGIEGLAYAAMYLVPIRLALWSLGVAIFSGKGSWKKVLFHPCLIATYSGLVIMIAGFNLPAIFSRLAFSLGNCTTPVSMLVMGHILASVDPKKIISKLTLYFTAVRLVLIPLITAGVFFLIGLLVNPLIMADRMVSGVSVILSGMPAPVTTVILADKYGADRELATKIVFVSTLLSIITSPCLALLLENI